MGIVDAARLTGLGVKRLVLELFLGCNSYCPPCHMDSGRLGEQEMALESSLAAIDQAVGFGINYLLATGGEVTLVDHLPDVISYAASKGMDTRINTNGWNKNPRYWEKLKESGLKYALVSIDASHNTSITGNTSPIPLDDALATANILIDLSIPTFVVQSKVDSAPSTETEIFLKIYELFESLGGVTDLNNRGLPVWELSANGVLHHLALRDIFYDGRVREYYSDVGRHLAKKCPSGVNMDNAFSIRVNPYNQVRVPCASDKIMMVEPTLWVPNDEESLIRPIQRLAADNQFTDFLAHGLDQPKEYICDFCMRSYLNNGK